MNYHCRESSLFSAIATLSQAANTLQLELGYKINGNVKPETTVLPLLVGNAYNRLVVTHRLEGGDYKLSIYINNKLVEKFTNYKPKSYAKMDYYSASPWKPAAFALVGQLK